MRHAIVAAVILTWMALGGVMPANGASCSAVALATGTCGAPPVSASVGNDVVNVGGQGASGGANSRGGGASGDAEEPPCIRNGFNWQCLGPLPATGGAAAVPPTVTWFDIASFRPTVGTDVMEPTGWTIAGLHSNFYATGSAHIANGSLFGFPAAVRFTPVSFRWSYGDGTTLRSVTPGASWGTLGVAEFDPTATSHAYRASGTYPVDLTITYTAEYRYAGSGWEPVVGSLEFPAPRITATVGSASTVLVDRDCRAVRASTGC